MEDKRIKSEIENFRSMIIRMAKFTDDVSHVIIEAFPWIKPYNVLTENDEGIHVIYDISQGSGRFILFNHDMGYLSYLGETSQEAVNLYNYSDLYSEKLVDEETGLVTTMSVISLEF